MDGIIKYSLLAGLVSLCDGVAEVAELESCKVILPDGSGIVDLTSLGTTDSTPRFKDVKCENDGMLYSYNACGDFVEGSCMEASVCMVTPDRSRYDLIGKAGSARYQYDRESKILLAGYFSGTPPYRVVEVEMTCDVSACTAQLVPHGPDSHGEIYLTIIPPNTTVLKYANSLDPEQTTRNSTQLFAVVSVYFIGGVLFMKFKKKASGSDVIPNKELWKSVPGLVKTGFMFLLSKYSSRRSGYINS